MSDTLRGQVKSENQRAGSGTGTCALCRRVDHLQTSHIMPKFVGKWIKDTSLTGFMSNIINNKIKRVQDLPTLPLLCRDCEQRFSRFEKYFADKIFYPVHKDNVTELKYDYRLELFAVSLGWRTLISHYESLKSNHPIFNKQIELAESTWREFLLGNRQTVHPYENHLTFSVRVDNEEMNRYLDRSVDSTIVSDSSRMFAYTKLVHIIFITPIQPTTLNGWEGTHICRNGRIKSPHRINDNGYWDFLLDRAKILSGNHILKPSDETWRKRLQKAYNNNPKKFFESERTKKVIENMLVHYQQKVADMPPLVKGLIDEIGRQVANTQAETTENIWNSKKILDALASLPMKEATKIDSEIRDTINRLFNTGQSTICHLKVSTIWIIFIANHNTAKPDQRVVIEKELAKINTERSNEDTPIAIFSMNYEDDGVSFEFGFLMPPDTSSHVTPPTG